MGSEVQAVLDGFYRKRAETEDAQPHVVPMDVDDAAAPSPLPAASAPAPPLPTLELIQECAASHDMGKLVASLQSLYAQQVQAASSLVRAPPPSLSCSEAAIFLIRATDSDSSPLFAVAEEYLPILLSTAPPSPDVLKHVFLTTRWSDIAMTMP